MSASWTAVLLASVIAFGLKLSGYLIPPRWLEQPRISSALTVLPAALLAALVMTQTFATGRHLTVDARVIGLVVAAIALSRRAPFIVVVVLGALAAAATRAAGWG
ncbi:MAG: AzlD domain-containing protein [Frankiaceae bacterium]|nr:AzlD domain-containing protein [Frankiaceae bacterium]MBV9871869.1 AzlD domain-containing protein [Frankiaceae bacterium]